MAKKENNELVNRNQAFLIYQDDNGIARVNVRFEGEDVWLIQEQMSQVATRFRQWATARLREFIQKGFVLDDERLKGNRSRYFRELIDKEKEGK